MDAIRQLMGGLNARDFRDAVVTEEMFEALVRGTRHRSDVVRWWSMQLLDHCPDKRAFDAVVPLLDDPVDRVPSQCGSRSWLSSLQAQFQCQV